MEEKQIYKLIPKIMGEVGSISKKCLQGSAINYAFRGIDDLYLALQAPLSENGVFFVPEVLDTKREERQTKAGGALTVTLLTIKYTFFAPDGSSITSVVVGEAMDTSDKSCNKAMSAGLKYALLQIFCIPTEEAKDTEYDNHEPIHKTAPNPQKPASQPYGSGGQGRGITEPQSKRLYAISQKNGWSPQDVMDYLSNIGLSSSKELNRIQYDALCEAMEKYPRNQQEKK